MDGVIFTSAIKKELFKQILLDLGIGAKTNVGYGQFEP
jgi:CRISPR-associated protein Cmr6